MSQITTKGPGHDEAIPPSRNTDQAIQIFQAYASAIDPRFHESYMKLADVLERNMPRAFELVMQYGFPTYVVPLATYPDGYLHRKNEPLPFVSLGAQKRHLAIYHMGLLGNDKLLSWFEEEYRRVVPTKLNMGKSCIRLTNPQTMPYELIGQLAQRVSVEDWIAQYERYLGNR